MIIYIFFLEVIILWLWYNRIVRKEVLYEGSINWRTWKLLIKYKDDIINNLLLRVNYSEQKKQNIERIKRYIGRYIYQSIFIAWYFVIYPFIMVYILDLRENIGEIIICSAVVICMLTSKLKDCTQNYINILNTYLEEVIIPLEKGTLLVPVAGNELVKIEWTKKKTLLAILFGVLAVFGYILFYWIQWCISYLHLNDTFGKIGFFLFCVWLIYDIIRGKLESRKCKTDVNWFLSDEYESVEEEIRNLCQKLHLSGITFVTFNDSVPNAYVVPREGGMWIVGVTNGLLDEFKVIVKESGVLMEENEVEKMILATVSHELGHIYYRDYTREKWRPLVSIIVCIVIIYLDVYFMGIQEVSKIFILLGSILVFGILFFCKNNV